MSTTNDKIATVDNGRMINSLRDDAFEMERIDLCHSVVRALPKYFEYPNYETIKGVSRQGLFG